MKAKPKPGNNKHTRRNKIILAIAILSVAVILSAAYFWVLPQWRIRSMPSLTAKSAIVLNANSGKVLYGINEHEQLYPASMTKIAALLLFFEKLEEGALSYGDLIPISSNAVNVSASKAGLKPGEHISVDTLLKCILLPSGSDAVIALGEYIYGNEAALLLAMQEKAAELSLGDTHFTNCVGMHEAGHVSSAYDMGRLAYELVSRYPKVYEYSSLQAAVLKHEDGSETVLINTNDMLDEAGVCGLKTGSGSSDYNIAITYKKGGKHLIIIVLSSPSHEFRKLACMDILNAFR